MSSSKNRTAPGIPPVASPRAPTTDARVRSLPPDLMAQACKRVAIASIAFATLWAFELLMGVKFARAAGDMGIMALGAWPVPGLAVVAAGLTLSIGMLFVAGALSERPQLLLDLGLVFMVLTAGLIGLINQWQPFDSPGRVSWICILILIHPAIAPNTPSKVMLASFLAASMDPLWFGIALLRGVDPQVSAVGQAWTFTSNYLCALLAVVPAKIFFRMGSQVRQARELGSYRLGERIGGGGMGEVFRAEHRLLARPAAIKLIRPELLGNGRRHDGEVAMARFRREAEAAALLRSPHTIELYDFGVTDDGAFYYVMEFLDGASLEQLVERHGPMRADRAVNLMIQACDSLAEAHARGLIHRDIKPSNLFASRVGLEVDFVKVLDFGLVKADPSHYHEVDPMLTAPNVATGTPAFMAPEVALGEATADPRVDVYALGCVLYWLLTGRWVFESDSPLKLMHLHIAEPPEPPSHRTELPVPAALDALVLACLAKTPDDRPHDAGELRQRLADLGLADGWSRDRAQRWWHAHQPEQPEPCDPCDQGEVRPVLTGA